MGPISSREQSPSVIMKTDEITNRISDAIDAPGRECDLEMQNTRGTNWKQQQLWDLGIWPEDARTVV